MLDFSQLGSSCTKEEDFCCALHILYCIYSAPWVLSRKLSVMNERLHIKCIVNIVYLYTVPLAGGDLFQSMPHLTRAEWHQVWLQCRSDSCSNKHFHRLSSSIFSKTEGEKKVKMWKYHHYQYPAGSFCQTNPPKLIPLFAIAISALITVCINLSKKNSRSSSLEDFKRH